MKIILLDTETTSIDGHLIQLAYRLYSDQTMEGEFQSLYKPPEPISFGAMAINHITNEMVEKLLPFEGHEKARLQGLLNDHIMVAHNAAFDVGILEKEGVTAGQVICTYKVAYALFPELESHNLQYLRYALGLNDAELDKVSAHDAMGDVMVLERLFAKCLAKMSKDRPIEQCLKMMIDMSGQPLLLRKLTFGKHKGQEFKDVPLDYLRWLKQTFGQKKEKPDDPNLVYTVQYHLSQKSSK